MSRISSIRTLTALRTQRWPFKWSWGFLGAAGSAIRLEKEALYTLSNTKRREEERCLGSEGVGLSEGRSISIS